jgi:ubiquinone/menaquinone biosynthesis C-methylase UbiE
MGCCTVAGTEKMFSHQAKRYAKRYRRRGLDEAQRIMLKKLGWAGIDGRKILEVGCGAGGLHLSLLRRGAASAIGIEISEGMIAQAKKLAGELGVEDKVSYLRGDMVSMSGSAGSADIVLLDKVLCCYANPEALIRISTAKATMIYAVSYPRNAWFARVGFSVVERMGILFHWSFHPFYHPPTWLDATIKSQGFQEIDSGSTLIWQVKVFRREGVSM